MNIFAFLQPAPHCERLPADQIDSSYKKYRYQNFLGIFIGYATYYLLRGNFSLAIPYLIKDGYTKTQLGLVSSALLVAYGISKFIMGNLSDHSNPRYFIATGLTISILVNMMLGCSVWATSSLVVMYLLMFIGGWAQGMGAPPCYRTVAHWFAPSERGRVMSIWNVSHNIGASLLCLISMAAISLLTWRSIFYLPSLIAIVLTMVILILMCDTPQSVGLMPIEEYSKETTVNKTNDIAIDSEKELSGKEIIFKYVIVNKHVWFLAMANVFVYFIRYGVSSWAPTYLTEVKNLAINRSFLGPATYEIAGIIGILLCGFLSDKLFKGNRAIVSIICMILVGLGIILYWLSHSQVSIYFALLLIGMFIYGPVMLVGVQVLDIMPKKAVGTTIGLLGLFGYWGGTIAATAGFGCLVDHLGWDGGFIILMVSSILAIFFFSMTLNVKK